MTPEYRLGVIQRRADQAAKLVHPLLIAGSQDQIELAHDLLNHLAAIRLQAGLIELEAPTA